MAGPTKASGHQIGAYLIDAPIGQGALGPVYRGRHRESGHPVAVRVIRSDLAANPRFIDALRAEATRVRELRHPHVASLLDGGFSTVPHLVYEWIDGMGLGARLVSPPPLNAIQVAEIVIMVAKALAYAHRRKILHCHLKPGNIFLTRSGLIKVLDFAHPSHPRALSMLGAVDPYAAPETYQGSQDNRSDIYSLGVVMYELLAGHPPFEARTAAELAALHSNEAVPALTAADPILSGICYKLLEKDRATRFQNVENLGRALEDWLRSSPGRGGRSATARQPAPQGPPLAGAPVPGAGRAATGRQARRPLFGATPAGHQRMATQRRPAGFGGSDAPVQDLAPDPGETQPPSGYPDPPSGYPDPPSGYPDPSSGYPDPPSGYPDPPSGYPDPPSGYPEPASGYPDGGYGPQDPPPPEYELPGSDAVPVHAGIAAPEPRAEPAPEQGYGGGRVRVPEPVEEIDTVIEGDVDAQLSGLDIFTEPATSGQDTTSKVGGGSDLTPVLNGSTIETRPSSIHTQPRRPSSRTSPLMLALIGAALAFAATLAWVVANREPPPPPLITVSFAGVDAMLPRGAEARFGAPGYEEKVTYTSKSFPPGQYNLVIARMGFVKVTRAVELKPGEAPPQLSKIRIPETLAPEEEVIDFEEKATEALDARMFDEARQFLDRLDAYAPGYADELGLRSRLESEERTFQANEQERLERERRQILGEVEDCLANGDHTTALELLDQLEDDQTTQKLRLEIAEILRAATDLEITAESELEKGNWREALDALRDAQRLRPIHEPLNRLEALIFEARDLLNDSKHQQILARNNQAQLWGEVLDKLDRLAVTCPELDLKVRRKEAVAGKKNFDDLVAAFEDALGDERWSEAGRVAAELVGMATHEAAQEYVERYRLEVGELRFAVLAWIKGVLPLIPRRGSASTDGLAADAPADLFATFMASLEAEYPDGRVVSERFTHPESFPLERAENRLAYVSTWRLTLTLDSGASVELDLPVRVELRETDDGWELLDLTRAP